MKSKQCYSNSTTETKTYQTDVNISIGDSVRFLNNVGGGIVSKIEKNKVFVTDSDGFEIPVSISEVVVHNNAPQKSTPLLSKSTENSQQTVINPTVSQPTEVLCEKFDGPNNSLSFSLIVEKKESEFVLHLLSECDFRAFYTLGIVTPQNMIEHLSEGILDSHSNKNIHILPQKIFRSHLKLSITLTPFKNTTYTAQNLQRSLFECNPLVFFGTSEFQIHSSYANPIIIFPIVNTSENNIKKVVVPNKIYKLLQLKETTPTQSSPKNPYKEVEEFDLHIEELVEYPEKLEPFEKLSIQMTKFSSILKQALATKQQKKLIFIHGVGSGKLKSEIRNYINNNYPTLCYDDAPYAQYGLGATIVFVK